MVHLFPAHRIQMRLALAPSLGLSSASHDGTVEVPDSASHGAWVQMDRHFQLSQSDTAVVLQE